MGDSPVEGSRLKLTLFKKVLFLRESFEVFIDYKFGVVQIVRYGIIFMFSANKWKCFDYEWLV